MTSLNVYLAKKYGAKSTTSQIETTKKKKKKIKSTPTADKLGSVAIIDEEDITGQWKNVRSEDEEDENAPIVGNSLILSFFMLRRLAYWLFYSRSFYRIATIQQVEAYCRRYRRRSSTNWLEIVCSFVIIEHISYLTDYFFIL